MTCRFTGSHAHPCSTTKTAIPRYKPPRCAEALIYCNRHSDTGPWLQPPSPRIRLISRVMMNTKSPVPRDNRRNGHGGHLESYVCLITLVRFTSSRSIHTNGNASWHETRSTRYFACFLPRRSSTTSLLDGMS